MFLEKLRSEPASQDRLQKFLIHSGVVHCLKVVRNSSFHFSKVYCVFRLDFRAKMDFISQLCQFWSAHFKKVRYHFFLPRYQ
jgi:hypothetical protein